MRKLRKIAATMSFLLAMSLTVPVHGEETMDIGMKELTAENDVLTIYAGNDIADPSTPVDYSVEVDGVQKEIISISSIEQENAGVSYLFLVDISGSLTEKQSGAMKDTLKALVENMKDADNACLMLVGDYAETSDFTADKSELAAQIDAIEVKQEDTNLYYAIDKALDVLTKSEAVQTPKCLVVLSDGQDDQVEGITKDEVNEKIDGAHITICSVVPELKNGSAEKEEAAKLLGSFSRRSPGGIHQLLDSEDVTPETAAAAIAEVMDYALMIQADISGFSSEANEVYVEVGASAEGYGSAADGYFVNTTTISKGVTTAETESAETEPGTEGTEPGEPQQSEPESKNRKAILSIVAVILGAVIGIAVYFSRKKKNASEETTAENTPQTPENIAFKKPAEEKTKAPEFARNMAKEEPQPSVVTYETEAALYEPRK